MTTVSPNPRPGVRGRILAQTGLGPAKGRGGFGAKRPKSVLTQSVMPGRRPQLGLGDDCIPVETQPPPFSSDRKLNPQSDSQGGAGPAGALALLRTPALNLLRLG